MTPEERFEKNTKLVFHVLNRYFKKSANDEDFIQLGMLALWKACLSYQEEFGFRFSSYACQVIKNELGNELRHMFSKRRDVRVNKISLDAHIDTADDLYLKDVLSKTTEWESETDDKMLIEEFLIDLYESMTDRQRIVFDRVIISNEPYIDVAESIGVSYGTIHNTVDSIRAKANKLKREKYPELISVQ